MGGRGAELCYVEAVKELEMKGSDDADVKIISATFRC